MQSFCEMFKSRDFINALRNFAKSVSARIFAKFRYLAKQFILKESPDHLGRFLTLSVWGGGGAGMNLKGF